MTTATIGASKGRIALFDNIKGMLIILVVVGHFMHPVHNENPSMSALFDVIYLFHMPLFVFVSGLFAKGARRGGHLNWNRIIAFLVLGFAYQFALLAINGVLPGKPYRMLLFTSAPWYLIGMAWWYLATPALDRLGPRKGVLASTALSLAWGLVDLSNGFLAISRTIAFLPCFALGYACSAGTVERLSRRRGLWGAVALAALIAAARIVDPNAYDWFFQMVYGDNPYTSGLVCGIAAKLVALAVAAVFSLALLRLMPKGRSALTTLGERTLQVYVLHRLVRAWLTFHTGLYDLPIMLDPVAGLAIALAISALTIALCALPWFTEPFTALMRHRWLPHRTT